MRYLTLPFVIVGLVLALALAGPIRERYEATTQHQRTLQLIEAQRQTFDLQQYQVEQSAGLPAKIATRYGLIILLFVGAGGLLWTARDAYMQRRAPIVRFDAARPLVARQLIERADPMLIEAMLAALQLDGQAAIERARASGAVPTSYAPHITVTGPKAQPVEPPALLPDAAQLVERPPLTLLPGECTLAALQRTGIVARSGNSLHVGNAVADGTPIYLELATWGALALGGKSRTGKTSRITYFLAQAALNGWRLVVLDKHGAGGKADALLAKVQPLESSFLLPAAVSQADMNRRIQQVYTIGKRRIENHDTTRYPIVLVVDEFTNLILNGWLDDKTLDQLMSIANEHAGVNVHAMIIGHDWSASCLGKERGAAFRRITTHRIAHRLDAAGAQFLLPSGMGKQAEGLTIGQAIYVDDTGEPILVDCPLLHDEDIRYAAEHAGRYVGTFQGVPASVAIDDATPALHQPYTSAAPDLTPPSVAQQDAENPRAARVRALLCQQRGQTEVICEVWHLDPKERGAAYKNALEEYRAIVAQLVGGAA